MVHGSKPERHSQGSYLDVACSHPNAHVMVRWSHPRRRHGTEREEQTSNPWMATFPKYHQTYSDAHECVGATLAETSWSHGSPSQPCLNRIESRCLEHSGRFRFCDTTHKGLLCVQTVSTENPVCRDARDALLTHKYLQDNFHHVQAGQNLSLSGTALCA